VLSYAPSLQDFHAMRASRFCAFLIPVVISSVAFGQGGQMPPTTVEVARPTVDRVVERVSAVGTLRAAENIIVRPEVQGLIERVHFQEGQSVKAGDPLFTLDASLVRAEVNEWEATVAQSRREADRAKELVARKLAAESDLDAKRSQVTVDEARLSSAQTRLSKTVIKAPFAGVVGLRKVSPGEYVTAGQELVSLVQLDPIKLDFRVPESSLGHIKTGQAVNIEVDAFPNETFSGAVYAIDPQLDTAGRSVNLRATIANTKSQLRPGLFARVSLELGARADALLLPEQALWPQGDKQFVYVVDNGTAKLVEVSIGVRQGGMVEITHGLDKDAQVITAGQLKIGPGSPVQPLDAVASGAANRPAH
jgi:membrane fusion protein, multidrug efflux system